MSPRRGSATARIRFLAIGVAACLAAGVGAAVHEHRGQAEAAPRLERAPAASTTTTTSLMDGAEPLAPPPPPATTEQGPASSTTSGGPASGPPAGTGAGPDEASPFWMQADPDAGAAANRMVVWTGCGDVARLSDAELDTWRNRGVGGFVCIIRHLRPLGGSHAFTADPDHALAGGEYALQRQIRDSRIVDRARARGMKLYLGFYLVNHQNGRTPLAEWFDDGSWSATVLPAVRDVAGAARVLGFAGAAFDQELYPQARGATATWDWDYPGRTHSETDVRAKVRQRGAEMMRAIVGPFPGAEIVDYHSWFPESWNELVQQEVNGRLHAHRPSVQIDLWDGLTSVEGYGALRLMDATFYKTAHLAGASWDTALAYDHNRVYSLLSRRLSNWAYAGQRIHRSPFAWISSGETDFERARSPDHVAAQLQAFRRWGLGGEFANYAYGGLSRFDYRPYEAGMRAATQPGVVDTVPPSLEVTSVAVRGDVATISGHATDDMAVRMVGWATDGDRRGAAAMTWRVLSGDARQGYDWRTDWVATVPVGSGGASVTIGVEDVKGHVTVQTLRVDG